MEQVEVGNKVELEIQIDGVKNGQKFDSKVLKVVDENKAVLAMTKRGKYELELPIGSKYKFTIYTRSGMLTYNGRIDSYQAIIIDGLPEICAVVEFEFTGEKTQRREFFRFGCEIPMSFKRNSELFSSVSVSDNTGIIVDLSAGGVKFLTNVALEKGESVSIEVFLIDEFFFLETEVIFDDSIDHETYDYQYRCKFNNLVDSDRDKIIQYVFDIQRDRLKKRKFAN